MDMKLTICADKNGIAQWINSYQHPVCWSDDMIDLCNVLEMRSGGRLVGYMLFMFETQENVALHLCMRPGTFKLWTKSALKDYHKFAELMGAKRLVVNNAGQFAELLLRLGYDKIGPQQHGIIIPNKWTRYGRHNKRI